MSQLPVDMQTEIFSFLSPQGKLNYIRSLLNNNLNKILNNKHSQDANEFVQHIKILNLQDTDFNEAELRK